MKLTSSYIALLTIVLISCNNKTNQQYITSINNLSVQLENAANNYSTIDSLALVEIRKNVKNNCSRIDNLTDSVNIKVFIPYCQLNKSVKQILRMDFQIKKELYKSRTQTSDLLYDAKNNIIDTILLKKYINDEKRVIDIIIDRMNYNYERVLAETHRYDSLNPLIENIINNNN